MAALCISIHALLAESDQNRPRPSTRIYNFYPRSPCGERPTTIITICTVSKFLSTLSLRRATRLKPRQTRTDTNFYPRSPCGERQSASGILRFNPLISIHALLAESDYTAKMIVSQVRISIHALLAESDWPNHLKGLRLWNFYPRSPCGERQKTLKLLAST